MATAASGSCAHALPALLSDANGEISLFHFALSEIVETTLTRSRRTETPLSAHGLRFAAGLAQD
jgi:hypothetical protein